jgi:hypothetical protein
MWPTFALLELILSAVVRKYLFKESVIIGCLSLKFPSVYMAEYVA